VERQHLCARLSDRQDRSAETNRAGFIADLLPVSGDRSSKFEQIDRKSSKAFDRVNFIDESPDDLDRISEIK
jgi:hypothetical protein